MSVVRSFAMRRRDRPETSLRHREAHLLRSSPRRVRGEPRRCACRRGDVIGVEQQGTRRAETVILSINEQRIGRTPRQTTSPRRAACGCRLDADHGVCLQIWALGAPASGTGAAGVIEVRGWAAQARDAGHARLCCGRGGQPGGRLAGRRRRSAAVSSPGQTSSSSSDSSSRTGAAAGRRWALGRGRT
jgi:hypothetical protein